jgi:single-stranded DNA-binding protein
MAEEKQKAVVKIVYHNHVELMGYVTLDPDLRYTPSGASVMEFRMAANKRYKDKNDEWRDKTIDRKSVV